MLVKYCSAIPSFLSFSSGGTAGFCGAGGFGGTGGFWGTAGFSSSIWYESLSSGVDVPDTLDFSLSESPVNNHIILTCNVDGL